VVSRETRLFAEEVQDDLAVVGAGAVLEEVDALPGAEGGAAVEDGDREVDLGEDGFEVGRHVVGAFGVVVVGAVLGDEAIEVGLDVAADGGVGVLLDEERGGGVAAEEGEEAGLNVLAADPLGDGRGELVEAGAAGGDCEGVGGLGQDASPLRSLPLLGEMLKAGIGC
jgi:hypothetical protein